MTTNGHEGIKTTAKERAFLRRLLALDHKLYTADELRATDELGFALYGEAWSLNSLAKKGVVRTYGKTHYAWIGKGWTRDELRALANED